MDDWEPMIFVHHSQLFSLEYFKATSEVCQRTMMRRPRLGEML